MALPPDRIEDLLEEAGASGVVVVATVDSVVDSGPRIVVDVFDEQGRYIQQAPGSGQPSQPAQLVTLNVEHVLLGRLRERQLTASKPPAPYWLSTTAPDNAGVFFMSRDASGGFAIAGHFGPFSISEEEARRELGPHGKRRRWWRLGSGSS